MAERRGDWSRPCRDCGRLPGQTTFNSSKRGDALFRKSYCLDCCRKRSKDYDLRNPERARLRESRRCRDFAHEALLREVRKSKDPEKHKQRVRSNNIRRCYKISSVEYDNKLNLQGDICSICKKPMTRFKKGPVLDHDHRTGRLRDFLCVTCNVLLGMADDDVGLLESAVAYLENFNGRR